MIREPIKHPSCELCGMPATVHCTWGLFEIGGIPRNEPMQEADLCQACSDELWKRNAGAVNAGLMYWRNSFPKEESKVKDEM